MNVLVLCTIGTPLDTTRKSVRKYLLNFLGDRHIISIAQPFRYLLTRFIIVPVRLTKSQKRYKKLASLFQGELPLRLYINDLRDKMQSENTRWRVLSYMQYSDLTPHSLIDNILKEPNVEKIVILPLFAHQTFGSYYASFDKIEQLLRKTFKHTTIKVVPPYYNHQSYIKPLQQLIFRSSTLSFDLYVASFHSIPVSHWKRGLQKGFDYKAQCFETARLLFSTLPDKSNKEVLFQSSIKPHSWLGPTIEHQMYTWLSKGYKRVCVICPGFAIDCLETLIDIGDELRSRFIECGGEELYLAPCLNSLPEARRLYFQLADESIV